MFAISIGELIRLADEYRLSLNPRWIEVERVGWNNKGPFPWAYTVARNFALPTLTESPLDGLLIIEFDMKTALGFYLVENWEDVGGRTKWDPCFGSQELPG